VHAIGQTNVTTIIDIETMATTSTIVVEADILQLHIGFDPIKLGVGFEDNATNGQKGLAHDSKVR
jgi:hypothetical protein